MSTAGSEQEVSGCRPMPVPVKGWYSSSPWYAGTAPHAGAGHGILHGMSLRELLGGVDAVRFPVLIGFAVVVLLSGFAGVAHGPGGVAAPARLVSVRARPGPDRRSRS